MRNETHHHHQQLYYQHKKTMFLPILCSRPTIKDVSLPRSITSNSSSCNDPLSPRIGCMGQVKRNNKIAGFPSHTNYNRLITFSNNKTTTLPPTISPLVKYSKLKSFFSSKNLTNTTTTTPSTTKSTTNFSSCRTKQTLSRNQRCRNKNESVNIEGMDPPLPVIKKVVKLEEGECLWKRRSGGPAIKSLQLQQIHHHQQNMSPQPTTV